MFGWLSFCSVDPIGFLLDSKTARAMGWDQERRFASRRASSKKFKKAGKGIRDTGKGWCLKGVGKQEKGSYGSWPAIESKPSRGWKLYLIYERTHKLYIKAFPQKFLPFFKFSLRAAIPIHRLGIDSHVKKHEIPPVLHTI